ncbi:MAG: pyrimidine dimer DNA glycosylase/endonuclease V [Pontibacterium sp.]
MRIWDIDPGYLNRQSLLGKHRELHGMVSIIAHNKRVIHVTLRPFVGLAVAGCCKTAPAVCRRNALKRLCR